ncbi:MAG: universal stress protein [Motiliproteus sp.]
MYRKICVAVDGSDSSHEAVRAASELARQFGASLVLIHVIRPMKIPQELQRYIKEDDLATIRHSALENVGKEIVAKALEIAISHEIEHAQTLILSGDPAGQIIEVARKESADLIVMGTRGLGKVEGALIGSISRKVTEMSEMNVMIVKQRVRTNR